MMLLKFRVGLYCCKCCWMNFLKLLGNIEIKFVMGKSSNGKLNKDGLKIYIKKENISSMYYF